MNLWNRIKASWKPTPISPPQVDPELPHLDGITRSAESIKYSILSVEWWISPNGRVREWLRHNTHLAAWLIIPAMLVVPVVSFVLSQVMHWTAMLTTITRHLILLPILVLLLVVVLILVVAVVKAVLR